MILFMCEEYVLKLLQIYLFFTLYITTINHHYSKLFVIDLDDIQL